MKKTAIAPSNIAFVKYWGKKDALLRLPENGSISMNLSALTTTTTVDFDPLYASDEVMIDGKIDKEEGARVSEQLDRIRAMAHIHTYARVMSKNSFPAGTGLSSSASGFAALTVAAAAAAGLALSEKELSILARFGSGSACRSIPDGFVEWLGGEDSDSSYAVSLYKPDYWDIVDIVTIVSDERKKIATTEGQGYANSSPFYATRLSGMEETINATKQALANKKFTALGELAEAEALNMHAVMLTSKPALLYWTPNTLLLLQTIQSWRTEGIPVYFTVNTGQDVHLLCEAAYSVALEEKIKELGIAKSILINHPSVGTRLDEQHLF